MNSCSPYVHMNVKFIWVIEVCTSKLLYGTPRVDRLKRGWDLSCSWAHGYVTCNRGWKGRIRVFHVIITTRLYLSSLLLSIDRERIRILFHSASSFVNKNSFEQEGGKESSLYFWNRPVFPRNTRNKRTHVSGVPGSPVVRSNQKERSSVSREKGTRREEKNIALQEIYNNGTMELSVRDLAGLLLEPYRPRATLRQVHPWRRMGPTYFSSPPPFITFLLETRAFSRKPPPLLEAAHAMSLELAADIIRSRRETSVDRDWEVTIYRFAERGQDISSSRGAPPSFLLV